MTTTHKGFHVEHVLHELKHYLPAQAPLMDFVHHNTLHAFQHLPFHEALRKAQTSLGYQVYLSLDQFRELYQTKRINDAILNQVIEKKKGAKKTAEWKYKLLHQDVENVPSPRIGALRGQWKKVYNIDLDSMVHPNLFRLISSYLDQGISIWHFPIENKSFLEAIKELEKKSWISLFKGKRAKNLLLNEHTTLEDVLNILVGSHPHLFEQYLFDQQFAHQGWSGMVSTVEDLPQTLLDRRQISLHDLIMLECLLEIDTIDYLLSDGWTGLGNTLEKPLPSLLDPIEYSEVMDILSIWQEAFEWTYYDQVLAGIQQSSRNPIFGGPKSFQGLFCIDDRECSFRRYLESVDPQCDTYGTPGFFSVEFFYQPIGGKFYSKLCPAPVTPKFLIKEIGDEKKREKDLYFSKHSHNFYTGWIISQTLGFWSALKLFGNIFKPSMSPATASSLRHMDKFSQLQVDYDALIQQENGLQIGFKIDEMANRVESMLKSIGLVKDFAPIVYVVGHGASSVNNPHYAAYDCGACSGRAGSVNARVVSKMANKSEVRAILRERGIEIPDSTIFVGALHDTTRDEVVFYTDEIKDNHYLTLHAEHVLVFERALDLNAKERSRRFESINTELSPKEIHEKIRLRSVSLFEPRPELNHATNALCLVGRRELSKGIFLDRRSFLNSFDYRVDPTGEYLLNILKAAAPVCGGINLEYYFSRVDGEKLGAGTKLPHNVMGLFGVANGIDGDLRPGLPSQMTEVHDPIRLLLVVEHFPEVVLKTIQKSPETYEWFMNDWVILVSVHPETREVQLFEKGEFSPYSPINKPLERVREIESLLESNQENFPVYLIQQD
ncbi:YbcC family protein [Aquirufa ecclesiirivi]|uniref:YbcC family protein n=1 Tax=Aquirufa ecclesiirivi TaxID=2715124 RepID=UPI003BB0DEA6